MIFKRMLGAVAAAALSLASPYVAADAWPSKPVKLVVPFTAGGSTDTVARILADKLTPRLGQPVLVDNRAGAGGAIGSDFVAKSPHDGYTMLVGTSSTMAIAPYVYTKLAYNPTRDFAPVSLLGTADIIIVVNSQVPVRSVKDLLDYARANPGKLTFASGGNGSISHLVVLGPLRVRALERLLGVLAFGSVEDELQEDAVRFTQLPVLFDPPQESFAFLGWDLHLAKANDQRDRLESTDRSTV